MNGFGVFTGGFLIASITIDRDTNMWSSKTDLSECHQRLW